MEFNEKLQELRKQKGMTQEELAQALFVSRTAVSKWESGRGYPNIDSLKAIAKLFAITVDKLLSSDELLCIAEDETIKRQNHLRDITFGILDISTVLLFFLPLFGQGTGDAFSSVSLLSLVGISAYMRILYYACIAASVVFGVLILSLQNCNQYLWVRSKYWICLILNTITVILLILSKQPYAAVFVFIFLVIKATMFIKRQ